MKKLLLMGAAAMMLTACSEPDTKEKAATEQPDIVTANEMKNKLDAYMKENKQLMNDIHIDDLSPTKQQLNQLKETKSALDNSNQQLEQYIKNHDIPASYKEGTEQTLNYFQHVSDLLTDTEQPLADLAKGKISALSKLSGLPAKYSDALGHEQQQNVKQFLKDKDIDVSLFDNNLFDMVK